MNRVNRQVSKLESGLVKNCRSCFLNSVSRRFITLTTRASALGLLLVLIATLGISGCESLTPVRIYDTTGATQEKEVDSRLFYVVQKGDTLAKISRMHDTNWPTLAALNKLNEPDNIIPGMRLLIYPGYYLGEEGKLEPSIIFAEVVPKEPIEYEDHSSEVPSGSESPLPVEEQTPEQSAPKPAPETNAEQTPKPESKRRQPPPTVVVDSPVEGDGTKSKTSSPNSGKSGWQWPVRVRPRHGYTLAREGVDYVLPRGTNIVAAASGRAAHVGAGLGDFKHYVILIHKHGYVSIYGFNVDPVVRQDEMVARGDRIATVNVASEADRRFHFEIRKGGNPVNPASVLPGY